jgi:spermidine synthase
MSRDFEELDYQESELGPISLRRRRMVSLGDTDIFEVKLGEAFLMSSLFHDVEVALAELGLSELGSRDLDVVVGGLGLGYTAGAALRNPRIRSLLVVELLAPVIEWHRRGLVPLGAAVSGDARCRIIQGDFFALAASRQGFDVMNPGRRFDAVLLDIDHSPTNLLHPRNAPFYEPEGLRLLASHLVADGIFALWSDGLVDDAFLAVLGKVFVSSRAEVVKFENPILGGESASTIYIAREPRKDRAAED